MQADALISLFVYVFSSLAFRFRRVEAAEAMTERRISVTPRNVKQDPRLRIVSLGGVDEVGKNMTVFEYEDDIVVVDCGSIFPKEDMLGVDLVIPDVSYQIGRAHV